MPTHSLEILNLALCGPRGILPVAYNPTIHQCVGSENTKSWWKGKLNGKFLNQLIFQVAKCHTPSLIDLEICFNMQKQFLEKF